MFRNILNFCASVLLGLTCATGGYANDLGLTVAERQWLDEHPVIRITPDPDFPPYEWLTPDGEYHGIAADYMHLIEKKLGIKFEVVRTRTHSEFLALKIAHKIDVQPALARTIQRQKYMLFTQPYTSFPGVVVSNQEFRRVEDLQGREVAIVQDSYWDDLAASRESPIDIQHVDDTAFGIKAAALGAVDAMITDLASATAAIQQAGVTGLNIINDPANKLGRLEHSIAVRKDWPELQSILDKALASISREEHDALLSDWIKFEEPAFWRQRDFWYTVAIVLVVFLGLFMAFYTWNRRLKTLVRQRTGELQKVQEKLMQAEKLESIGRMAAGVAHEVKNPLAIIQMGADYLSQELSKDTTAMEVIVDINDAVQRADTVIHGLLDFSRDKKLTLNPGDINEVIRSALHLVEHELHQRNMVAKLLLNDDLPLMALDSNKLQQVFINLFMNAIHAMNRDGELIVSSKIVSGSDIQVEVADTGPGIREQDKAKIFDLFYTTKAVGEGTGLGLSVSHNIVKLHGGTIDIGNRIEGGALVVMLFKLKKGDEL